MLNGATLNQIPYAPESAPEIDRILRDVYGVDLRNPHAPISPWGLQPGAGTDLWATRSVPEWRRLGRDYGVTDVLCFKDVPLPLPIVASETRMVLYAIPDGEPASGHR